MFEVTLCSSEGRVLTKVNLADWAAKGGRRLLIGRADDCDLQIRSPAISRHHCAIEHLEGDDWTLRDLGSTHGTVINGHRIEEEPIETGMEARIGPALLRFASIETGSSREGVDTPGSAVQGRGG